MGRFTTSLGDLSKQARQRARRGEEVLPTDHWRPKTRADCSKVSRPCPYVGCRYNLFLDVATNGSLRTPHTEEPDKVLSQKQSCALDLAEEGRMTLSKVGEAHALTRERVRQIEVGAWAKLREVLSDVPRTGIDGPLDEHSLIDVGSVREQFAQASSAEFAAPE